MMRIAWILPCASLFVLLSEDASVENWVLGCALGLALVPAFPRSEGVSFLHALVRLACLPWFLIGTVAQIIQGSATLGWSLLTSRRFNASAVVAVENPTRSRAAVHVLSLVFSASPGTVVLGFDEGRDVLLVHAFDERVAASAGRSFDRFYQRYQRWSFP